MPVFSVKITLGNIQSLLGKKIVFKNTPVYATQE